VNKDYLKILIKNLPGKPGVYLFKDMHGHIIYVGKAKNLKKRVSSYFDKKKYDTYKTSLLVKKIHDIEKIVVDSESDAFLLENNLIKQYQPKYNILLKDDKSFPWICIKNEPFPRVFSTRNVVKDGSEYFGPYTSAYMVKTLLLLIRQLYQLRTCNHNLSQTNIVNKKFKVCLEYHIDNCKGPCEGHQTEADYGHAIAQIRNILKGNLKEVQDHLYDLMQEYAKEYKFEQAENVKDKINIIKKYKSKSTIVNPKISNIDVFGMVDNGKNVYVNYLKVIDGAIIQSHTVEVKRKLNESLNEILGFVVTDMRQRLKSQSGEILLQLMPNQQMGDVKYTIPAKGDKKKLLDLSIRNAKYFLKDQQKQNEKISKKFSNKSTEVLNELKNVLSLSKIPDHIECFDNSNLGGTNPVAACVVFKNGLPAKSDYRKYNIKTVTGPDDYASMREVIYRRYARYINEKLSLPVLVIVDGGKGQLNAAVDSLKELNIHDKTAVIGIAKRLEEIYQPGDAVPLFIDKNSPALKLIQRIRNEAHRFGIGFHRDKRSAEMTRSEIQHIKGIGPKTYEKLIRKYKSLANVKQTPDNELIKFIGGDKARKIKDYLNRQG
jgi:excinuclease ABC subunit C